MTTSLPSLSGQRCVVTGAAGFIGSHLVEALVRDGAHVTAMVHYNALGLRGWLDDSPAAAGLEVVAGDLTDRDSVGSIVRGADVVFHLGALIAIPYSYAAPESYVRTNVLGTLNVLQAARDAGVRRVVHTSTSEVYGSARYVPIDEAHPLQGQSPYSASKIGADKIAEAYFASFEVPVVTVRPFNTYGPRQSARAVIPTIITQCLAGGEVKLGSLAPTRDLTFVDDTVRGFVRAALVPDVAGETINLGTGREISIGDLAALIAALTGATPRIVEDAPRLRPARSEVERLLSDNRKAKRLLQWEPAVTLEEGLARTVEWFRANQARYRAHAYNV
jgi:dTDP-glucose 4,6-dehydratase